MISSIKYVETQYIVIKVKLMSTGSSKSFGVPGESRTPNLLIRSQMLYPIELRMQLFESARVGNTLKRSAKIAHFLEFSEFFQRIVGKIIQERCKTLLYRYFAHPYEVITYPIGLCRYVRNACSCAIV